MADANGVEPLEGESEADYVARQTRLREEAAARMRAKFGGSGGLNGGMRMGGIGSNGGGGSGGGSGLGSGAAAALGTAASVGSWIFGAAKETAVAATAAASAAASAARERAVAATSFDTANDLAHLKGAGREPRPTNDISDLLGSASISAGGNGLGGRSAAGGGANGGFAAGRSAAGGGAVGGDASKDDDFFGSWGDEVSAPNGGARGGSSLRGSNGGGALSASTALPSRAGEAEPATLSVAGEALANAQAELMGGAGVESEAARPASGAPVVGGVVSKSKKVAAVKCDSKWDDWEDDKW